MTWTPPTDNAIHRSPVDPEREFFFHDIALQQLLEADVLFVCGTKSQDFAFAVNCNDTFYRACADCEDVKYGELKDLYQKWREIGPEGPIVWAAFKRGCRPADYVVERWKSKGLWDDALEALPPP